MNVTSNISIRVSNVNSLVSSLALSDDDDNVLCSIWEDVTCDFVLDDIENELNDGLAKGDKVNASTTFDLFVINNRVEMR